MALPLRSSPSHRCEGYLHRVIVVADFDSSPGLGEGGGGGTQCRLIESFVG